MLAPKSRIFTGRPAFFYQSADWKLSKYHQRIFSVSQPGQAGIEDLGSSSHEGWPRFGWARRRPDKGQPVWSQNKLMNVEHRTSNIEHRIRHSVYLIMTERSDSTIRQSSFVIRHSFIRGRRLEVYAKKKYFIFNLFTWCLSRWLFGLFSRQPTARRRHPFTFCNYPFLWQ